MKNVVSKFLSFVLLAVFLLDLYFIWINQNESRFFTKTLLLPLLILIYITESKQHINLTTSQLNKNFLIGLVLSFFGDFFLLFKWGFLPGLGSFLLAHVFYILCFYKLIKRKASRAFVYMVSMYLIGFITFLYPYLNEMKIPVTVYGIVISLMLYFSTRTANNFLILGALLFVISDTVLAVNLFVKESQILSLLVMITYVAAQFFLVRGMLKEAKPVQNSIHNIQ